jgi:hypothetical protein
MENVAAAARYDGEVFQRLGGSGWNGRKNERHGQRRASKHSGKERAGHSHGNKPFVC